MRLRRTIGLCCSFVAAVSVAGRDSQDQVFRADVRLVSVDVSVQDAAGHFVTGLTAEDFAVYDDGKQQRIVAFGASDIPVTVGLIVDNSGSMKPKRSDVVTAGLLFAKASNPRDEFFVINFNDHVYEALPRGTAFTDQLQVLHSALFYGVPQGRTAIYDAVDAGLRHLAGGHRDMRVLIVVSDGGDNASKTSLKQVLARIDKSRAVIFCIGLLDPEDRDLNPHVLRRISGMSGGALYLPATPDDLGAVFEKISGDIRNRYSLGFAASASGHGVHKIRVAVHDNEGEKLRAHYRSSYEAGS